MGEGTFVRIFRRLNGELNTEGRGIPTRFVLDVDSDFVFLKKTVDPYIKNGNYCKLFNGQIVESSSAAA